MKLGDLPSHTASPALGDVGAVAAAGVHDAATIHAVSGNQLLGIDAWHGVDAGGRVFAGGERLPGSAATHMEALVEHILAPLS